MAHETAQHQWLDGRDDRRRVPRYWCSGEAQIACLPLHGALVRGRVRDLGLGGCCIEGIETPSRFDLGAQTEVLMEVNSWFFRALGHVRALRSRSGISVEFMHMSAGGYSMLADLIADLERPLAGVTRRRSVVESSGRVPGNKSGVGQVLNGDAAIVGTVVAAQTAEERSSAANCQGRVRYFHPRVVSVDIFV
jgi:hypothetical protein